MAELVVIGSGETAPAMLRTHRSTLAAAGVGPGPAVFLDTPFAFQVNAGQLVSTIESYFATSVGTPIAAVRWPATGPAGTERALADLESARWIFAGPGSPSYALRHWHDTPVPRTLRQRVESGASVVFGSAAACTLGSHCIPVYEIYKAGAEPQLLPGLDLLAAVTGLRAMVVPHFNNAEGGRYDTRFCYLGAERLALLEATLPEGTGVLGVDEHTALRIDLETRLARVEGVGSVTVRHRGAETVLPSGGEITLGDLALMLHTGMSAGPPGPPAVAEPARGDDGALAAPSRTSFGTSDGTPSGPAAALADGAPPPTLEREANRIGERFESAFRARDVAGCVDAALELQQTIVDWSSDTDQNTHAADAHRLLRRMLLRLGELAGDPGAVAARLGEVISPFVRALLDVRRRARADRQFDIADSVRDALTELRVEVQDRPEGVHWRLDPGTLEEPVGGMVEP